MAIKIRTLQKNNEGAAGVVVAVLLIALLITFLSIIQTIHIPDWAEEREAEHMEKVANQFSQLKFATDVLSTIEKSGNKITTTITLGTKEIPILFLTSDKSFGFLKIVTDECMLTITDQTPISYSYLLGSIQYSSRNSYYINIDYIYEAGGVITNQKLGNTMYIMPYFSVTYASSVDITYDIVSFIDIAGKEYISGHGTHQIQIEYARKNTTTIMNVDTITITTDYLLAWHDFLNSTLLASGLTYGDSNDFVITENNTEITIDFNDALSVDITLKIVDINIQIGPGWIEKIE